MMRGLSLVVASLVLMAGSLLFSLSGLVFHPVQRAAASSSYCATPEDIAILNDVNQHRAENGLPPLVLSADLGDAANYHSEDMATNNYFDHQLSDGTGWSQNIRNFGYDQNTWRGENIAAGNSDPDATYQQWLNSPGHNANMLSPNFTSIGIGHASDPSSQWGNYWTQTFGGYVDTPAVACDGSDPNAGYTSDSSNAPTGGQQASQPDSGRAPRGSQDAAAPAGANSQPAQPARVPRSATSSGDQASTGSSDQPARPARPVATDQSNQQPSTATPAQPVTGGQPVGGGQATDSQTHTPRGGSGDVVGGTSDQSQSSGRATRGDQSPVQQLDPSRPARG